MRGMRHALLAGPAVSAVPMPLDAGTTRGRCQSNYRPTPNSRERRASYESRGAGWAALSAYTRAPHSAEALLMFRCVRFLAASIAFGPMVAFAQTTVFISEIHYDNASTDSNEAVEVAGPAGP